jgi:autotransporter-associated beta strand protein
MANTVTVAVNAQATLGQLDFLGQGGISLQGTGPLLFDNPGANPASIRTVLAQGGSLDGKISAPVSIASGESLLLDLATGKNLELSGSILSAEGDVTKIGAGSLTLSGDNSAWTGSVTVDAGELVVRDVNALASSRNVQIGPNGFLTFVPQDVTGQRDASYVIPSASINGGIIQTKLTTISSRGEIRGIVAATRVNMNLHLTGDSSIRLTSFDTVSMDGTISGPGGLRFEKRIVNVPGGSSGLPFISINGSTSYSGETVIGPEMRVAFRQSAALGDASAGTLVDRGTLELHAGGGSEQIEVRRGRLALIEALDPYGHDVFLQQGQLFGGDDDGLAATLNTTVNYSGGAALGTESGGDNLVLAGGISGTGSVFSLNQVEIRGELSARGHFIATSRGPARLSGKLSQAGDVFVSDTQLELTGDLESPQGTFFLNPGFITSRMVAKQSNTLESVVIDPRSAERDGFHELFRLGAENGAVLTIADELRFYGGTLHGAITGQSLLTKKDRAAGVLENIQGAGFTRVNVEGGQLTLRGDAGDSPPAIHLGTHDTSRLVVDDVGTYRGDIYLNNARANDRQAALAVAGNTVLAGNIYLGDLGSSLSTILSSEEVAEITGVVHGGDFTVKGRQEIRLRSGAHTYSGATHVLAENFRLVDDGKLNSTSMIVGYGRIGTGGGRAGLFLDNSGEAAHEDRIPDSTPLYLNGMKVALIGRAGEQVTESLGTLHTTRGLSEIVVDNPSMSSSETTLRIETLNRQPGTALLFDLGQNGGQVRFATAPTLDDNLIGGWAVVRGYSYFGQQDFATYGPDGVAAYSDSHAYKTDLLTAAASDNVALLGQATLTGDTSINALKLRDGHIRLDGHTLTIESGGLLLDRFGDTISGGRLTAGTADGAELFVSGIGSIEADIVDNAHGAVGLTYASDSGELRLSGTNIYTGPTVFSAGNGNSVELLSPTALPAGTDLKVSGTDLRVTYASESPIVLGDVEVIDNGLIRAAVGNPPALRPTSIHIESGVFSELDILGNGPITKTGPDSAFFGLSLATHTGPITIEEGRFVADAFGAAPLDDEHAITVHRGASLRTSSDVVLAGRKIRLDGGILDIELRSSISAPVEILAAGGFIRNERGVTVITSPVTGQGPLVVEGGFGNGLVSFEANLNAFEGPLRITGGFIDMRGSNANYSQPIEVAASRLSVLGTNVLGTGQVTILPDGRLNVVNIVTGNLVLAGGALGMAPGNLLESPRLRGNLSIAEDSYLFISALFDGRRLSPVIDSTLRLSDATNLKISPDVASQPDQVAASAFFHHVQEQITLAGDIVVHGEASMTSFDASVRLTGAIRPGTERATLNLIGNDTFAILGSIRLDDAKSLAITIDGQAAPITLSGSGNRLAGSGTYIGDIALTSGASIAPGDSAGLLTVDGDLSLGAGGRLAIELGGTLPGNQYDSLDVLGNVTLTNAVLDVSLIENFIPDPKQGFVILRANQIEGRFINASTTILIGRLELPITYRPNAIVLGNALVIPEPCSLMLASISLIGLIAMSRKRV